MNIATRTILVAFCIAFVAQAQQKPAVVATGLDVLIEKGFEPIAGKRVGLVTNQTGIDASGRGIVDIFLAQKAFRLVALFSPEHGFEGKLDEKVSSSKHASGLEIHSLYGDVRKPTREMLEGVDCLVFDIQSIGCRFYTYIATMGLTMQAAREHGLRYIVLDRPNPIGGERVEGPMLSGVDESFVAWHSLPVRHGMTVGELARLFVKEREELNGLDLVVIPCRGLDRAMLFDQTGLPFVPPSPNMRNLYEATLYPGVGLIETTNVSVGRGTDTPFERIGAPWIDGNALARRLRTAAVPGVSCYPIRFVPASSKFEGELCQGVAFVVEDRRKLDSVRFGFEVATALRDLFGASWKSEKYVRLLANRQVFERFRDGASASELMNLAQRGMDAFVARRRAVLLY
ncbi:MAG: DUF1343 domain-containing protein [Planctomycetes bacterium]|nr:DUF1343 domain-containing protein [Planctomycetota bacterium]